MPYRIEYASSNRAACKGPKPCSGTKIQKGELRLGTQIEILGSQTFQWRHWGCTTGKIISNIIDKDGISKPQDLDGWDDLQKEDKHRVARAFATGQVEDKDVPESARVPPPSAQEGEATNSQAAQKKGDRKPPAETEAAKTQQVPPHPTAAAADNEEAPKKKRGRPPKEKVKDAESSTNDTSGTEEPIPKRGRGRPPKAGNASPQSASATPGSDAKTNAPKKPRGRPPKVAAAGAVTPSSAPAALGDGEKKPRGRPRKS